MNILGQVTVYPKPATRISRLTELAYNLWWSWCPEAQALYESVDPELWKTVNHNPVRFLRNVSQQKLDRVARDAGYVEHYDGVMAQFDAYMHPESTWYKSTYPNLGDNLIAYFSAEFGLHEALPIYSGGLGVLSGDHCKAASDLGLPFVGVGFLYPQGYFQQRIDGDGRQQAIYEKLSFADVPATRALRPDGGELIVSVDLAGRTLYAKVWRLQVGRVPVYLMDTDVERNAPADRELLARLYGGNQEIRIAQEFVLGIGGVRLLRALGLRPTAWHMNEGHAAFLQLERIREFVQEQGLSFPEASWTAKADTLFTTHTPVPAGNDSFPPALVERFFSEFWGQMGIGRDTFIDLGAHEYPWGPQFSMTVLALRTVGRANGVSRLHGEVSREMWHNLWLEVPLPEVPIGHVTNGIHTASWLDPRLGVLYDRYLGAAWREHIDNPAAWANLCEIPDDELWGEHQRAKERMLHLVRERMVNHLVRVGAEPVEINAAARGFDPQVFTIGFARRFATYKRAPLIFRDQERLKRILHNPARPVQILFSGKAHPADEPGKAMIQQVYELSLQPGFAGKIAFVEDYDINLGRHMVAGVDLWLNNPRRPLEASGTSGQKAGLNGIPSLSVLDGWWVEGYNGENGWAIGEERKYLDEGTQDAADALSLYTQLEENIIPLYYTQGSDGLPHAWVAKMKAAIQSIAPAYSLSRMLKEYVDRYYVPQDVQGQRLRADSFQRARSLAQWEQRVLGGWPRVSVRASGPQRSEMHVGETVSIQAVLTSPAVLVDDLAVEVVYGLEVEGDLADARVLPMLQTGREGDQYHYQADLTSPSSGSFVYGVRVRPQADDLPNPFALGVLQWA